MLEVNGTRKGVKKWLIMATAAVVLLLAVAGYLLWQILKQDSAEAIITRVTSQVSTMLHVPIDEEPQVAKVTEPDKIKDQPFFANVQKDDYLLVYQKAKLAILYREKDRKLINVDHVELTPEKN